MADLKMILDAGTSLGTLVLAAVTVGAVRSANRAARVAERSLLAGLRPVLLTSTLDDRVEKVIWIRRSAAIGTSTVRIPASVAV